MQRGTTHVTFPLQKGPLLGNALNKVCELIENQQLKTSEDDHDILVQLEVQNYDQFDMIKDM